jgi:hypothetical protein
MVPVFMNPYFDSEACRKELARMLHREEILGLRTPAQPEGLILPVRLSSRTYFPDIARHIQDEDFTTFAIPNLAPNTLTHEKFDEKIRQFTLTAAAAIRKAPAYDAAWQDLDGGAFLPRLLSKPLAISQPPRISA